MSTVAQIKEALGRLTPDEYCEIADWVAEHVPAVAAERVAEIQHKLDDAERGTFRKVNPEEQIIKLAASVQ